MSEPIHGNYQGYYHKRPSAADPRLALLPPTFFRGKTVLDVGCNEGWVTCEIAQRWGAKMVVGVDIDGELVAGAWKRRKTIWSLQSPSISADRTEKKRKRPQQELEETLQGERVLDLSLAQHFPASLVRSFGPLPFAEEEEGSTSFPHNLSFRTADWAKDGIQEDSGGYDIIVAFSVVKWIHLNSGDEGLRKFFQRAFDSLLPGGEFVLEPQGWEGYAKAKRMDSTLKASYQALKLRPDGFGEILQAIGFDAGRRIGVPGEGGFKRPVDIYRKPGP